MKRNKESPQDLEAFIKEIIYMQKFQKEKKRRKVREII